MAAKDDYLAEVFRQAQLTLIRIITGSSGAGTKTYYNTVLRQLEKLMRQLSAETGKFIDMTIPAAYREGLDAVYDYFTRNGLAMKQPDMFARINSDAVHELCSEMQHHIDSGISQAGRRVIRYVDSARDNALRQSGLRSSAVKIAAGQTVRDMQKELTKRLTEEGFLTVQYGSGDKAYQVSLESYAAMVSRSTTREAGNLARENQLIHNGYDLMMMTEHYPTCPVCAMLQGRVYSISGNDKRFPPLSRAFSSGYKNVHPNCSHVMTPWIEELQSPEELKEALEKSGRPFQDLRSEEERALYSQQQAQARQLRADRSQFQRYKARLGDKAPSGFAQFRKLKTAGGEPWKELAKSYRESVDRSSISKGKAAPVTVSEPEKAEGAYTEEKIPKSDSPNLAKQFEPFNVDIVPSTTDITPEALEEELNKSEVGKEVLQYIEDAEIRPKLIYEPQQHDNRGQQWGNSIEIYVDNIRSPLVAAQTVIHEITHHKYGIGKCQWAEAVCMAKEKMHKENRTYLTIAEKRYIVGSAKKFYGEYNWKKGGTQYGRHL